MIEAVFALIGITLIIMVLYGGFGRIWKK